MRRLFFPVAIALVVCISSAHASDWPRFRGANGDGVSRDAASAPVDWSETKNLKWSVSLPGAGHSSPIVVGQRVIVTSWTGEDADVVRHLGCYDRASGKLLWQKDFKTPVPEEPYARMIREHGFASHTPASDGKRVYAFFGKGGVVACDLEGNVLWQESVGTGSDPHDWGTAASPVLYKNLVIVNAAAESMALVALDKNTGDEVWRQEAESLNGTWSTPAVLKAADGQEDIVIAVTGEIWGLNPDNGKLRWYVAGESGGRTNSQCASVIVDGDVAYVLGERGASTLAIRGGGKGDVTDTHVLWAANQRGRIGTPLLSDGLIYWFDGGVAICIDAADGKSVYRERLRGAARGTAVNSDPAVRQATALQSPGETQASTAEQSSEQPAGEDRGFGRPGEYGPALGRGGRGGGGGIFGADYGSPVAADGKLYFVRRGGDMHVIRLGRDFHPLAVNLFDSDDGEFSATPAISDGELFIRSTTKLYCVAGSD